MKKKILNSIIIEGLSKMIKMINSDQGTILMFHSILEEETDITSKDTEITSDFLKKIISYYTDEGYDFYSMDQVVDAVRSRNKKSKKFVAFTFDDGYKNNLDVAFPIFKEYNIPFTVYITCNFPEHKAELWWYGLRELLDRENYVNFKYNSKEYSFDASNEGNKQSTFKSIRTLILSCENPQDIYNAIFNKYAISLVDIIKQKSMSWEEILHLSSSKLVTIGAHTLTHPNLAKCSDEVVRYELSESRRILGAKIGREIDHFAYPFGSANECGIREFSILRDLGFKSGVTTISSNIRFTGKLSIYSLPRVTINPYFETEKIELYESGLISLLHKTKNLIKRK